MLRSLPSIHTCCCLHLLLLLAFSCSLGEADGGALDAGQSQRELLLQALKTGILSSLGLDREPDRPSEKPSDPELKRMFWLYREKLRELSGNYSTQSMTEYQDSSSPPRRMSTVLYPATGESNNYCVVKEIDADLVLLITQP